MYGEILYPTDGSEGAEAALDDVRNLAELYDATVHMLFVVDTTREGFGLGTDPHGESTSGMVGDPNRSTGQEFRTMVEEKGKQLVTVVADQLKGIKTTTTVLGGNPHQVILDYAERNDIDMIVMGTHGQTGLERYLISTVTEKVVRLSETPVMTISMGEPEY